MFIKDTDINEDFQDLVDNLEQFIRQLETYAKDLGYSNRMERDAVYDAIENATKTLKQTQEAFGNFEGFPK